MSRYNFFKKGGVVYPTPSLNLKHKSSDREEFYKVGESRLDKISYKYYGDPNYGYLILMANPNIASNETDITLSCMLRIPYPLNETINEINNFYRSYVDKNKIGF